MKLWNKVHIHPFTYFVFFMVLLSGLYRYLVMVFVIVIFHEIGHILLAHLFKRKVIRVEILPFGGLVKIDSYVSENIFKDLLIASGGILMQLFLAIILLFLVNNNILQVKTYLILSMYNKLIIAFNLIPIFPLDGAKILKLLEELFIPFKQTFIISFIISMLLIILCIIYKIELIYDNLLVFIFLLVMNYNEFKNRKFILYRFYLERINHDFKYKLIYINRVESMYKNKVHIIRGVDEKVYLKRKYFCKGK